jgi:hypothetical protein
VIVVNDNSITAVSGAHGAGLVNATVTVPLGTITGTNAYTYGTPPINNYNLPMLGL